ncbi:MAG: hypothetical protein ABSB50_17625 [Terracidiphilus sp.]|jgi:ABC-type transporter Mla subunit MlaD
MPVPEALTKLALTRSLELLLDHDREIGRLHASLQAALNVLGDRSPEFQALHASTAEMLAKDAAPFDLQATQQIQEILRLIRAS